MKLSGFLQNILYLNFTENIAESFGTDWRNRRSIRIKTFQSQIHSNVQSGIHTVFAK